MATVDVIIPTYKPGNKLLTILDMLLSQTVKPQKIILMNTERSFFESNQELCDKVATLPEVEVHHIKKEEFDHGKTRSDGVLFSQSDFFLCMTDDAVPADRFLIEQLLSPFQEEQVAVSYACQLPNQDSRVLERLTRSYNYPQKSRTKTKADIAALGIKAFFCSDVCAMYRRSAYDELGGFIQKAIFNEDMIFAHEALVHGFFVYYQAEAKVYHSHTYTNKMQLRRNFDLGVSQAEHPEVFDGIPSEGEGMKMVCRVVATLAKGGHFITIIRFCIQSGYKLMGYRLGRRYQKLSRKRILQLTLNQNYWNGLK